ncbi:cyclopropane fatty-acyl-phospholipid synthase-like methyltransferase [Bacillus ectoiniformans]|uniref:SAM-dependent methyltransferase n=1 Tax=Bacillus ectoiniformans TaxID=1494429 RepID=UPI00195BCFE8|nr:class I SAM-dependent methyltransferase [Bacillus ectoiniformans]MBM7647741.1 cyclopropane fatty-acyl-phospholipid synthase-like methyltransferase [Bacillus ectoiniformans]
MFSSFSKQFIDPEGTLGKIAGKIMFYENRKINEWTLDLLSVQDGDRLLEVGYGPGYAIELLSSRFEHLQIDGVDISETMKNEAESHNKELIANDRLHLFVDDIADFHTENQYDKIFTVNNYPLWSDRKKGLQNLFHMLKPGGKIAITVQPREEDADEQKTKEIGLMIRQDLEECGFSGCATYYKDVRPELTVCVTAVK